MQYVMASGYPRFGGKLFFRNIDAPRNFLKGAGGGGASGFDPDVIYKLYLI
jgi:hypothetical protein